MASAEDEARSLEAKLEELKPTIEDVIEASGIEDIRRAVREVFAQRLKVDDEQERREIARHEKLKQDGVLCEVVPVPEKPQHDWTSYTGVLPALAKKPVPPEMPA